MGRFRASVAEAVGDHVAHLRRGIRGRTLQDAGHQVARVLVAEAVATEALGVLFLVLHAPFADSLWIALLPGDVLVKALRSVSPVLHRLSQTTHTTPTKGTIMFASSSRVASHRVLGGPVRAIGVLLALVVGLTISTVPGPATAAGDPVKTEIAMAESSLATAVTRLGAHRYPKAVDALTSARRHTKRANAAAQALIGAPPTDPESDDPPGPPAVLAVLQLDYRMTTGAVALFNGQTNTEVVDNLGRLVTAAQVRRDAVLDAVIALPAEGDGADYADGMADNLGRYGREVEAIRTALDTFTLTPMSRTSLTNALARAQATRAQVTRAFGGGERVAH